jgi:thiol:disulfide interchange protein DsbA
VAGSQQWQAGVHYELVEPFEKTSPDKIVVTQFFWFGCPHCYTFEPHLVLWNRHKAADVELVRIPVTRGSNDHPHARLFYTLEVLGRSDLHHEIFDTIHRENNRLYVDGDDAQTRELQLAFARRHGIDADQFLAAYDSPAVQEKVHYAERVLRHYKVLKLPTFVVNGRYMTDMSRIGRSAPTLLALVDDLVASERSRSKAQASTNKPAQQPAAPIKQ